MKAFMESYAGFVPVTVVAAWVSNGVTYLQVEVRRLRWKSPFKRGESYTLTAYGCIPTQAVSRKKTGPRILPYHWGKIIFGEK